MTARFEESYDTIAQFIGAPGRASIALYRNTTEAINAVMYSLLTESRDGGNVITTMMEHNPNYVPWYAMCREILPRLGRRVDYRLARFDPAAASGLVPGLGLVERRRTSAIAAALGARSRQLASFVWGEAIFVTIGGALPGVLSGWALSFIITKILTGCSTRRRRTCSSRGLIWPLWAA